MHQTSSNGCCFARSASWALAIASWWDTSGEVKTAVSAKYLAQALKACGGMVELRASSPNSPMMFCVDGYRLLVMPMATEDTVKATKEAEGEAKLTAEVVTEAEAVADEAAEDTKAIANKD